MKTIYLVRHAKSSWEEPGLADEARPLLPIGIAKTQKVIQYLYDHKIKVDRILSSPAVRALETAKLIAQGIGYPPDEIIVDRNIYDGHFDPVMDTICSMPDHFHSLMIFGHNPSITDLAAYLVQSEIEDMPTSAVVCLNFKTDSWKKIREVRAKLGFFIHPKKL
jgi:phosphohistidine phosphatase